MAHLDVGDPAPDFELPGTGGRTYRLSDYRGRNLVLAFYPGDATRVCTAQFCSYRDNADRFDQLEAEVLGISPQSVDSHERWTREQELNIPLLADEDLAVSKSYGVTGWIGPLARVTGLGEAVDGRYVMRSIFVIDGEGIIRHRHVSRTSASFQSVEDIEEAVAKIPA
jgi:thioredoxin-dependent peroxiredoxin